MKCLKNPRESQPFHFYFTILLDFTLACAPVFLTGKQVSRRLSGSLCAFSQQRCGVWVQHLARFWQIEEYGGLLRTLPGTTGSRTLRHSTRERRFSLASSRLFWAREISVWKPRTDSRSRGRKLCSSLTASIDGTFPQYRLRPKKIFKSILKASRVGWLTRPGLATQKLGVQLSALPQT